MTDVHQSEPVLIERKSPVRAEVRTTVEGSALIYGDHVWVNNVLFEPEDAIAIAAALQEGAIQCRAMRAGK
jgi:hypothetical protein